MPIQANRATFERMALHQFTPLHCAQARELLDWSPRQLSRQSGVSIAAIMRFEAGGTLSDVTHLALAFSLEAQGLVFFPGYPPGRGINVRGATPDPKGRADFGRIE